MSRHTNVIETVILIIVDSGLFSRHKVTDVLIGRDMRESINIGYGIKSMVLVYQLHTDLHFNIFGTLIVSTASRKLDICLKHAPQVILRTFQMTSNSVPFVAEIIFIAYYVKVWTPI